MAKPELPGQNTVEYLWWCQGARDEAEARDEGLRPAVIEARNTLEALARLRRPGEQSTEDLIWALARIYCPGRLKRRHRG